jgi:hypothetical protein
LVLSFWLSTVDCLRYRCALTPLAVSLPIGSHLKT